MASKKGKQDKKGWVTFKSDGGAQHYCAEHASWAKDHAEGTPWVDGAPHDAICEACWSAKLELPSTEIIPASNSELKATAQELQPLQGVYDPNVDHLEGVLRRMWPEGTDLVFLSTENDRMPEPDQGYDRYVEKYYALYAVLDKLPWRIMESRAESRDQLLFECQSKDTGSQSDLRLVQYNGVKVALCKFGDCFFSGAPTFLVLNRADLNALLPD